MAIQTPILDKTFEADAQYTEGTIVKFDANGRVTQTTASTETPIGVVTGNNGASAPFFANVRLAGIARVKSAGSTTIAAGDRILPGASGQGAKDAQTLGTVSKKAILGVAVGSCAAVANNLVDVFLAPCLIPTT